MSRNDITGDEIKTGVPTKGYKKGYDKLDFTWIREQVAKQEVEKAKKNRTKV